MTPQEYTKRKSICSTTKKYSNFFLKYLKIAGQEVITIYNKSFQIDRAKLLIRLHLSNCIKYNKELFIDHRTLSSEIGCSTKTIQNAVCSMEKEGELIITEVGSIFSGRSSLYKLTKKGLNWLRNNAYKFLSKFDIVIEDTKKYIWTPREEWQLQTYKDLDYHSAVQDILDKYKLVKNPYGVI